MSLSVGGLISGLDTESIISQLMEVEKYPIVKLQTKEAAYQLKLSTYGSLSGTLSSLSSAASSLKDTDDFAKFTATSADTDIFTVSAGSDAATGSYNITVHELAKAHKLTSNSFSEEEAVGEGALTIQVGSGDEMTIDVAADDTLQDVADAINDEEGDVTASVIFDGTNYFLTLTANDTGEENKIYVSAVEAGTAGGDPENFDTTGLSRLVYDDAGTQNMNETQAATDARIDVDGVTNIKRSTNTLDDVITGVTMNLVKEAATESTALTIDRDTSAIVSTVDTFVSAYNSVISFLNSTQSYDADSGSAGTLLGDATAKLIQRRLSTLLNTELSGMDTINKLADLGITRDEDGKLEVSTSTLTEQLENEFEDVVQFFSQDTTGSEGFAVRLVDELEAMTNSVDGTIAARQEGIQRSIKDIQKSVERIEVRVASSETRMRAQFNALELLLSEYQATGDYLTQQITSLQNLSSAISKK